MEPEHHLDWSQFYANALRDALWKANARRKETLAKMTPNDWRAAVYREMWADTWYREPDNDPDDTSVESTVEVNTMSLRSNGNGTYPKATAAVESGAA